MGMYDVFGDAGDQLKIFDTACYYYNDSAYEKYKTEGKEYCFLGFIGGMLRSFGIGDAVPWRGLCYNYTPNFTVVDMGDEDEPTMLYGFSNGKLLCIIDEFDEEKIQNYEHLFGGGRVVIDYFGRRLRIKTVYQLRDYIATQRDADIKYKRANEKFIAVRHALYEFGKMIGKDKRLNDIYCSAIDNLSAIQHNEIDDILRYVNHYYEKIDESCYNNYGGYIDCVKFYSGENGNKNYLPAIFHEAKKYLTENNLNIEDYFVWNDTPEEDKPWIREIDEKIRKYTDNNSQ